MADFQNYDHQGRTKWQSGFFYIYQHRYNWFSKNSVFYDINGQIQVKNTRFQRLVLSELGMYEYVILLKWELQNGVRLTLIMLDDGPDVLL